MHLGCGLPIVVGVIVVHPAAVLDVSIGVYFDGTVAGTGEEVVLILVVIPILVRHKQ